MPLFQRNSKPIFYNKLIRLIGRAVTIPYESESMSKGRPKGKRYYTISISLTQDQANFLAKQPNASEVIRKLIDSLMGTENLTPIYVKFVELQNKISGLGKKIPELRSQRAQLAYSLLYDERDHFDINKALANPAFNLANPDDSLIDPLDKKGQLIKAKIRAIDEELKTISAEIERAEDELLKATQEKTE